MGIDVISPVEFADLSKSGKQVTLIDVRSPVEYREFHVGIAQNIPLDQLDPAAHELQRLRFADNLIQVGKMADITEAENQIATRIRPSLPVLDICEQRFLCRMAKRLGCHFCAQK